MCRSTTWMTVALGAQTESPAGAIQDAVGLDRVAPVDIAATAERRSGVQSD